MLRKLQFNGHGEQNKISLACLFLRFLGIEELYYSLSVPNILMGIMRTYLLSGGKAQRF
jgi:hypothetical protein